MSETRWPVASDPAEDYRVRHRVPRRPDGASLVVREEGGAGPGVTATAGVLLFLAGTVVTAVFAPYVVGRAARGHGPLVAVLLLVGTVADVGCRWAVGRRVGRPPALLHLGTQPHLHLGRADEPGFDLMLCEMAGPVGLAGVGLVLVVVGVLAGVAGVGAAGAVRLSGEVLLAGGALQAVLRRPRVRTVRAWRRAGR